MNKKVYATAAMILGGLVVGASVEHLRMAAKVPEMTTNEPAIVHHVQKVIRESSAQEGSQDALVASLKAKVEGLNAELKTLRLEREKLAVTPVEIKEDRGPERQRESWNDRIERMKIEEPDKYAEMQARREDFKTRMEQRSVDRKEFLSEVNVANMSTEQQANHARLVELTDKIDAAMKAMISGDAENSRDLRREMFESYGELGELYTSERQYLLAETAAAVGYKGEEAALFTAHLEDIIENTSMKPPVMGGRGGRGR